MKAATSSGQNMLSAWIKLAVAGTLGILAGIVAGLLVSWSLAPLVAWDVAATAYITVTWSRVLKFDADFVKKHALREDPTRIAADVVLVAASLVSLVAVTVLLGFTSGEGVAHIVAPLLSVLSVVVSWFTIHTVYALKYAELYYTAPEGGIDFGDDKSPLYIDFAYLAFTVGMCYQVSDSTLKGRAFRIAALKQALLSYLFGTIIIATTINLIAGLGK